MIIPVIQDQNKILTSPTPQKAKNWLFFRLQSSETSVCTITVVLQNMEKLELV